MVPVTTNQAVLAIIPKPTFCAEFGAYLLKFYADKLIQCNVQSTQKNVNKGIVEQFPIPLPPLPEQQAIARVLRAVQRAKEATERIIQAMRELKKSLMRHLFTYGPVPVGEAERVSLKDTEIGLIPNHWNMVKLGEICKFQGGTQPPKKEFKYTPQHGYIRLLQIRDFETDEHATFVRYSSKLRIVKEDDVLIARYGASIGKILRGKSGAINVAIVKTIPNENMITKDYLFYRLQQDDFQEFVKGLGGRSAQAGFNKDMFALPLPPLSEQREITRVLGAVDKKLQAEEARKQALETLFKTLLHNLMTGKVRVKDLALPETKEAV
ncbi:MAG: restriction endonuclease subunit S [Bacillota bacterium]